MTEFNVGNVVRVEGQSTRMTVDAVGEAAFGMEGKIYCIWFDSLDQLQRAILNNDILVFVSK